MDPDEMRRIPGVAKRRHIQVDSMADLIDRIDDGNAFAFLHLAGPEASALEKYEAAASHSLAGYKHLVTADFIRHVRNRKHGDSLPVSNEDLLKLPALLAAPDSVGPSKNQRKQVMSIDVISDDGSKYSVILEIRKGNRKLATVTLVKH